METPFSQFLQNSVVWATLAAWLVAQTSKVLLSGFKTRRFDFRWFIGTGGMPSSHSAGGVALATGVGLQSGFHTAAFAIAFCFALIVMFDAQGVRRAAGHQAMILNKMMDEVYAKGEVSEDRLRELVGHTPFEVIVGALLGCLIAMGICR